MANLLLWDIGADRLISVWQSINHMRTEQAAATGAEIVAVACPFCI